MEIKVLTPKEYKKFLRKQKTNIVYKNGTTPENSYLTGKDLPYILMPSIAIVDK